MNKIFHLLVLLTLSIIFLSSDILPCFAQVNADNTQQLALTNTQDLETFFNQTFSQKMLEHHVPGATLTLVKDDKILLSKGYGFAELDQQIPINPDKTLFRLGSIAKLFTATAIMQLSEQGRLKLNDDVNKYLQKFQLEKTYSQPITFANLLTHTAGFDERNIGTATRNVSEIKPLEKYLQQRIPPRVLPPGQVIQYSNHGITLAGYLVEVISGMPFAEYINEKIFRPLGMDNSSFFQPLPKSLEINLAQGYEYKHGKYQKVVQDYVHVAPAEALYATTSDMARFMLAHLQNRSNSNPRILNVATAEEMHKQHFTYDSRLPGYAYGFYERFYNNQRAIVHSGNWRGFSSYLILLPQQNLGFFIAHNSYGTKFTQEVIRAFFDRYYPDKKQITNPQIPVNIQKLNTELIGSYRYKRYAKFSLEKLKTLVSQYNVKSGKNGSFIFDNDQFFPMEPLLLRSANSGKYVVLKTDNNERVTNIFMQDFNFEKLPWYETSSFQFSLFGFFFLAFLYGFINWAIGHLLFSRKKHHHRISKINKLVITLSGLVSILNLVFLVSVILSLLLISQWEFNYGVPYILLVSLCIPLVSMSITIGLPFLNVLACRNKDWSIKQKLHYSLITVAALLFMPFLNYWNLLGFRF
jgi:CubicO group peptidase (beta-lactamase class C family)